MILGPITLIDCVFFVLCLIPNLLLLAGPIATLSLVKVLPFLGTFAYSSRFRMLGCFVTW